MSDLQCLVMKHSIAHEPALCSQRGWLPAGTSKDMMASMSHQLSSRPCHALRGKQCPLLSSRLLIEWFSYPEKLKEGLEDTDTRAPALVALSTQEGSRGWTYWPESFSIWCVHLRDEGVRQIVFR